MNKTPIEWCDESVNPIRARDKITGKVGHWCTKISPGCAACYASRLQGRFRMHEFVAANRDKVELFLDAGTLQQVLRRRKPTRIFWCDMTDMFGEWVPDEWIDRCFAVMALTPQHTHMVLTKRAERMRAYISAPDRTAQIAAAILATGHPNAIVVGAYMQHGIRLREDEAPTPNWPLPNVWLGVSVESQEYAEERIPLLLQTPAAVRFISAEPLLGRVDLAMEGMCGGINPRPMVFNHRDESGAPWWRETTGGVAGIAGDLWHGGDVSMRNFRVPAGIHWVIVGGESGPGARPCDVAWIRSIVEQCKAADVACFVKQLGARPRLAHVVHDPPIYVPAKKHGKRARGYSGTVATTTYLYLKSRKGGDMAEWPEDLRVRQFPGGAA